MLTWKQCFHELELLVTSVLCLCRKVRVRIEGTRQNNNVYLGERELIGRTASMSDEGQILSVRRGSNENQTD